MDDDVDQRIHDLESAQASLESQVCARKISQCIFVGIGFVRSLLTLVSRRTAALWNAETCFVCVNRGSSRLWRRATSSARHTRCVVRVMERVALSMVTSKQLLMQNRLAVFFCIFCAGGKTQTPTTTTELFCVCCCDDAVAQGYMYVL